MCILSAVSGQISSHTSGCSRRPPYQGRPLRSRQPRTSWQTHLAGAPPPSWRTPRRTCTYSSNLQRMSAQFNNQHRYTILARNAERGNEERAIIAAHWVRARSNGLQQRPLQQRPYLHFPSLPLPRQPFRTCGCSALCHMDTSLAHSSRRCCSTTWRPRKDAERREWDGPIQHMKLRLEPRRLEPKCIYAYTCIHQNINYPRKAP